MKSRLEIQNHHNIPVSHMGAGNNGNLSPLESGRHHKYHSIAGHPTPDMILRRMLLSGLTCSGGTVYPRSFINEMLTQLQWENSDFLYEEGGFCVYKNTNGHKEKGGIERKKARSITHRADQLAFEHDLTRSALSHLTLGKLLPQEDISFHQRNMEFFSAQTPSEAMRRFLIEKATDGHLAWARPMQQGVRSQLLDTLKGAKYQKPSKKEKERIIDTVNNFLINDVLPASLQTAREYRKYTKALASYNNN
ncbi:hypothetical protein HOL63_01570 [Candidatus Peregrinibacteria bacterium]|jgi:hypothetical protein|nr:hypothetical protein [Candidatus Peregrinibacteria bacterium]MBT5468142.1 hypothetical protein [Candidatus Peregrinibacteria bacterium]MBT7337952.1 hypothetical protein [Candidatus Peregrinibacteria bacterium]